MPENWKTYKLENLASIKGGKRMPKGVALLETPTDHPYIRVTNMGQRKIPLDQLLYVPNEVFDKISRYIVSKNDVILSIVGTIGAVAIISDELHNANLTENCVKLTELKDIHHSFLYYYLKSNIGQNEIAKGIVGSTQPKLPLYNIQNIDIELPPLDEQKSIASILSALDDKIELNLQMNRTLEEMAMALYKHWFMDFGPFQDGEFVATELGEIPKGWKNAILGDLINLNPRLSLAKGSQASFVEMKVLPIDVMSVSDVAQKAFKGGAKFQNGDTLFARITPCLENGKTAFVDFLEAGEIAFGSTEFLVMRAKEGVSKYWTYCLARDINFRNFAVSTMVGTSGRQRVQNDPFLSYEIPQPPKEIFDSFSEIAEPWFNQIRINTIENQTLTQLRDTLLPKLISGEVRVKDVEKTLTEVL